MSGSDKGIHRLIALLDTMNKHQVGEQFGFIKLAVTHSWKLNLL